MAYFFAVFVALMVAERWVARGRGNEEAYEPADTRASVLSGLGAFAVHAASKGALLAGLCGLYAWTPLRLPADHWATWLLAIVVLDFCLYWAHRFSHETRLGWAIHVTHHSSRRYNLSVALRQNWTTNLLALFFVPLPLLGVPIEVVVAAKLLSSLYQFWLHTELIGRLPGWFEWVFNTPSHHRVHHSSNPRYLDTNYGGTFIVWDRAFGTFEPEVERPVYGLTQNIASHGVFYINFHEWRAMLREVRAARSWREGLGYVLRRPGWQPSRARASETGVDWLEVCASTLVSGILGEEAHASSVSKIGSRG